MTKSLFQDKRMENMQLKLNKLHRASSMLMVIIIILTIISVMWAFMVNPATAVIITAFTFTISVALCFVLFETRNLCDDIECIYYAQDYSL